VDESEPHDFLTPFVEEGGDALAFAVETDSMRAR
jgi:hypothetical protein